ncbi:SPASM domain-containing protein, partial [Salmonella enterica]|uniref:SPASM domain-containing protein n=1 Tax=Salmonella enterica TaxID=28901 RepID=UPI0010F84589
KATLCCMSSGEDPHLDIGDVNTNSLYEVYNNPRIRNLRETLISRKKIPIEDLPCAGCQY